MNYSNYSKPIQDLIECFKKIPGIGEKSAERMALWAVDADNDLIEDFASSLIACKQIIKRCTICNNYATDELCTICADNSRDNSVICVVEKPKNVILFEKTGSYKGKYHVLDGLITGGKTPKNINIDALISRVNSNVVSEVILALEPSIDGEVTSLYVSKLLDGKGVSVSKLAHGVPLGADMDYLDLLTLETALADRKQINGK